jgi:hypothetical protein
LAALTPLKITPRALMSASRPLDGGAYWGSGLPFRVNVVGAAGAAGAVLEQAATRTTAETTARRLLGIALLLLDAVPIDY